MQGWQFAAVGTGAALCVFFWEACILGIADFYATGGSGTWGAGLAAGGLTGAEAAGASRVVSGAESAVAGGMLAEDLRTAQMANSVVDSLRETGRLPANYVTKQAAAAAGWKSGKALENYVPGGQIGGDLFEKPASIGLSTAPGRTWYEADVGLSGSMGRNKQPGTRLLYSSDGLAYVTPDHYRRLYRLPDWR